MSAKLKHNLLAVVVFLLAFSLRVASIDQIPAGLSHDEAYNGITAIQVLEGQRSIFFEINKGIEPLIIYLEALAFYLFGIGPVQLRLVNILFGMLTVALVYPFTARLFNRRVALLAMTGIAISFWAIFVSRLTLRAVLLPPLLLFTLYLFWRGLQFKYQLAIDSWQLPKALLFFALSGLTAGITMYTYLSSRFLPFIIITIFGYQLVCQKINKVHWIGLLLHVVIWAAIFSPLATYFVENSQSFTRRSNQVTTIPHALNGDFEPMLRNTVRTLGMFTFQGDTTDRYNLDSRPVFDWINGLLFYVGVGLAVWQLLRRPRQASSQVLLLSAAFFMLVPDFITDDSPHFLRTIGALPIVYIFWALGLSVIGNQLSVISDQAISYLSSHPTSQTPHLKFHIPFIIHHSAFIILFTLTTLHTGYDYFNRWANAPEARYIYGADVAEVAQYVKDSLNDGLVVISAEYYRDLDPFRFALHFQGHPPFVIWFDGGQTLAFPPPESNLAPRYAFTASAPPADTWQEFLQPSPQESGLAYELYRLPEAAELRQVQDSLNSLQVNVNNDLILSGYQILGDVVSGGKFHVLLGWQALRTLPPGTDYTFLMQMRDNQGNLWVETDGNGYAPGDWQPGVQALQLLTVRLPGDLPPRTFNLTVEVVDRAIGQVLPTGFGETVIPLESVPAKLADKPRYVDVEQLPNPVDEDVLSQPNVLDNASGVVLRGHKLSRRTVSSGKTLLLTLHWQVLQQPQHNYKLQFLLEDEQGNRVYNWPVVEPVNGEWPTSQWPAEYWVQDKVSVPVAPDVPVGFFNLRAQWVDSTGLPLLDSALEPGFNLGTLRIEPQ